MPQGLTVGNLNASLKAIGLLTNLLSRTDAVNQQQVDVSCLDKIHQSISSYV